MQSALERDGAFAVLEPGRTLMRAACADHHSSDLHAT